LSGLSDDVSLPFGERTRLWRCGCRHRM